MRIWIQVWVLSAIGVDADSRCRWIELWIFRYGGSVDLFCVLLFVILSMRWDTFYLKFAARVNITVSKIFPVLALFKTIESHFKIEDVGFKRLVWVSTGQVSMKNPRIPESHLSYPNDRTDYRPGSTPRRVQATNSPGLTPFNHATWNWARAALILRGACILVLSFLNPDSQTQVWWRAERASSGGLTVSGMNRAVVHIIDSVHVPCSRYMFQVQVQALYLVRPTSQVRTGAMGSGTGQESFVYISCPMDFYYFSLLFNYLNFFLVNSSVSLGFFRCNST